MTALSNFAFHSVIAMVVKKRVKMMEGRTRAKVQHNSATICVLSYLRHWPGQRHWPSYSEFTTIFAVVRGGDRQATATRLWSTRTTRLALPPNNFIIDHIDIYIIPC